MFGDGYKMLNIEYHELVHAIDLPLHGGRGPALLTEGIATYLSYGRYGWPDLELTAAKIYAMIGVDSYSLSWEEYVLAAGLTGALIARHGMARWRQLRTVLSAKASLEDWDAAFLDVYGIRLADELAEIEASKAVIPSLWVDDGCTDEALDALDPWVWTEAPVEGVLHGSCGDPKTWVYGGVIDKQFAVELPTAGHYLLEMKSDADPDDVVFPAITGCTGIQVITFGAVGFPDAFYVYTDGPGRAITRATFLAGPNLGGAVRFKLQYTGDAPIVPPSP